MTPVVHCPYCAHPLRLEDEVFHCDAGEDEFSQWASSELLRALEGDPRAIPELEAEPATRWHCPRCASWMHRTPGKIFGAQCARCGCELKSSLEYNFAELRTHPYSEEERDEVARVLRRIGPRARDAE